MKKICNKCKEEFEGSLKSKRCPKCKKETNRIRAIRFRKNHQHAYNNLILWEKIIPKETQCEICSKKIFFNSKNSSNAIHFDHKNDKGISILGSPTSWLRSHKPTPKNIAKWLACRFGMLCKKCNGYLPTKNRKEWFKNIRNYIFNR